MFKQCFEIDEHNKLCTKKKQKVKAPALVHAMDSKFDPYSSARFAAFSTNIIAFYLQNTRLFVLNFIYSLIMMLF